MADDTPILHEIFAINATQDADVYKVDVDLTDVTGERYRCFYGSVPGDPYGLGPLIREYIVAHPDEIIAYVEPVLTDDEKRAAMPDLSAHQFWMAAASIDIDKDTIITTIKANMEDGVDRKMMIAELESSSFERVSPTIVDVMGMISIPAEQVDDLWIWAAGL